MFFHHEEREEHKETIKLFFNFDELVKRGLWTPVFTGVTTFCEFINFSLRDSSWFEFFYLLSYRYTAIAVPGLKRDVVFWLTD